MSAVIPNTFTLKTQDNSPNDVTVAPAERWTEINVQHLIKALKARSPAPKDIYFDECKLDNPQLFFAYLAERPPLLPANQPICLNAHSVPFAGGLLELDKGGARVVVKGGDKDPIDTVQLLNGIGAIEGLKKLEFQGATLDHPDALLTYFSCPASHKLTHIAFSDDAEFASLNGSTSLLGRPEAKQHILSKLATTLADGNSNSLVDVSIAGVNHKPLQALCAHNRPPRARPLT